MLDSLTPPTDNLYKFIAIGGLAFALVAFVFLLHEASARRDAFVSADVELRSSGYVENSGEPKDMELRKAWLRREWAKAGLQEFTKLSTGLVGNAMGLSIASSIIGFAAWWWRVQRHEDALLKLERDKLERELAPESVGRSN